MRRPLLTADVFMAALAMLTATACSKAASNSIQPAAEPAPANAPAPAASALGAPAPVADPAPPPPQPDTAATATASATIGGKELKRGAAPPSPSGKKDVKAACAAGGCSPDMKKGTP